MIPVAFTLKSNGGLLNVLQTSVNVHLPANQSGVPFNGIWDTGATGTAISQRVVDALGLIATGGRNVSTANGVVYQDTHIIDLGIPQLALIKGLVVTNLGTLSGGCDLLIGMDIIGLGDFSITNHNGETCMSFRMPSSHEIDYVKNLNLKSITPSTGSKFTAAKKKKEIVYSLVLFINTFLNFLHGLTGI